jgi:hypothetical protein
MLFVGTPLNQARAAIVQDLYRLAFIHQLEAGAPRAQEPIGDETLASLLDAMADVLDRTAHQEDAAIVKGLALDAAPRRSAALAR